MSSTNRGSERNMSDYYVTPLQPIKDFLRAWIIDENLSLIGKRFLDPCAGGDKNHVMSYVEAIRDVIHTENIFTIDIREDSRAMVKGDYLLTQINSKPDIIISNPPFSLAEEFITKALQDIKEGGYVIMLLRLNFLESSKRKQFFENNMPQRIYVYHKRMSFTDNGKTDSVAYMHAIWNKGQQLSETKLKII